MSTSLLIEAVAITLVHFIWQGAAVGLVVAILLACGRKHRQSASSTYRYTVALIGLGLLTVLPIITFCMQLGVFNDTSSNLQLVTGSTLLQAQSAPQVWQIPNQWLSVILLAWSVGVAWGSARLLISWLSLQYLQRSNIQTNPEWLEQELERLKRSIGISRNVRLLVSKVVRAPLTAGWLRPVLILPATALTGLPRDQLSLVMLHELAHIRRYDYLVNWLQNIVSVLFFYHPVVHWIAHVLSEERELCCDYSAIEKTDSPLDYAKTLLSLQQMRTPQLALGAQGDGKGVLLRRMQRLLNQEADTVALASQSGRPFACLLTIMVSALVTFTGVFGTQSSQAAYHSLTSHSVIEHPLNELPIWVEKRITQLDEISRKASIEPTHLIISEQSPQINQQPAPAARPELEATRPDTLLAPNSDLLQMPTLHHELHNDIKTQLKTMRTEQAGETMSQVYAGNTPAVLSEDLQMSITQQGFDEIGWRQDTGLPPQPLLKAMPKFPPNIITGRRTVSVHLTYSIDSTGQPFNIVALAEDIPEAYIDAAIEALEKWRFRPGTPRLKDLRISQQFDFVTPVQQQLNCITGSRICSHVGAQVIYVNTPSTGRG